MSKGEIGGERDVGSEGGRGGRDVGRKGGRKEGRESGLDQVSKSFRL